MHKVPKIALISASLLWIPLPAFSGGFIEDSSGTLTFRNYYFDRDYKGESNIKQQREWAQGFTLDIKSGYTEGPIGFGLDFLGQWGVKLDSSKDRAGTGLLPVGTDGRADNSYSEMGLTGKLRYSKTELHVGTLRPMLPVLISSPARLLWQTFQGGYLRSKDINDLSLHAGYLNRVNHRDSTDNEKIGVAAPNGRFNGAARSDEFLFFGGDYQAKPNLTLSYYYARLNEIYQQHYLGLQHSFGLGSGEFKSDLRYFLSDEAGEGKAGSVDNQSIIANFSYQQGTHKITLGGHLLSGDTALPYISSSEALRMAELAMNSDFSNPDEHYWDVRYDYDFAGWGIPGLTTVARFMKGTNIELAERYGGKGLEETERSFWVSYAVQSGPLKGVNFRIKNARYQNSFASNASFRDANQTRVEIWYSMKLW